MARESFLLRTDPKVLEAMRRWADDELRSVNGQIEFLLRKALRDAGRLKRDSGAAGNGAADTASDSGEDSGTDAGGVTRGE